MADTAVWTGREFILRWDRHPVGFSGVCAES